MKTSVTVVRKGNKVLVKKGRHPETVNGDGSIIVAIWKEFDYGTYFRIMQSMLKKIWVEPEVGRAHWEREQREEVIVPLIIKYLLQSISCMEIEHDRRGFVKSKSLKRVFALFPSIIKNLVAPLRKRMMLNEDEVEEIERQCSSFFGEQGGGVSDPCEAIAYHAMLGNFWEDYGLNYFDLMKLPVKIGAWLREVQACKAKIYNQQRGPKSKQPIRGVRPGAKSP